MIIKNTHKKGVLSKVIALLVAGLSLLASVFVMVGFTQKESEVQAYAAVSTYDITFNYYGKDVITMAVPVNTRPAPNVSVLELGANISADNDDCRIGGFSIDDSMDDYRLETLPLATASAKYFYGIENCITAKFKVNGEIVSKQKIDIETKPTLPPVPEWEGHAFKFWLANNSEYTVTMPTLYRSTEFTAVFMVVDNSFTFTFNYNMVDISPVNFTDHIFGGTPNIKVLDFFLSSYATVETENAIYHFDGLVNATADELLDPLVFKEYQVKPPYKTLNKFEVTYNYEDFDGTAKTIKQNYTQERNLPSIDNIPSVILENTRLKKDIATADLLNLPIENSTYTFPYYKTGNVTFEYITEAGYATTLTQRYIEVLAPLTYDTMPEVVRANKNINVDGTTARIISSGGYKDKTIKTMYLSKFISGRLPNGTLSREIPVFYATECEAFRHYIQTYPDFKAVYGMAFEENILKKHSDHGKYDYYFPVNAGGRLGKYSGYFKWFFPDVYTEVHSINYDSHGDLNSYTCTEAVGLTMPAIRLMVLSGSNPYMDFFTETLVSATIKNALNDKIMEIPLNGLKTVTKQVKDKDSGKIKDVLCYEYLWGIPLDFVGGIDFWGNLNIPLYDFSMTNVAAFETYRPVGLTLYIPVREDNQYPEMVFSYVKDSTPDNDDIVDDIIPPSVQDNLKDTLDKFMKMFNDIANFFGGVFNFVSSIDTSVLIPIVIIIVLLLFTTPLWIPLIPALIKLLFNIITLPIRLIVKLFKKIAKK